MKYKKLNRFNCFYDIYTIENEDKSVEVIAVSKNSEVAYTFIFDYDWIVQTIEDIKDDAELFGNEVLSDDAYYEESIELLTMFSISSPNLLKWRYS